MVHVLETAEAGAGAISIAPTEAAAASAPYSLAFLAIFMGIRPFN
jgi:hypothetical protein